MSKYRDREPIIYTATEISESESLKEKDTEFIELEQYKEILDDIESAVKRMVDILEDVRGIDIIEEVQTILDRLAEDLY